MATVAEKLKLQAWFWQQLFRQHWFHWDTLEAIGLGQLEAVIDSQTEQKQRQLADSTEAVENSLEVARTVEDNL